MIGSILGIVSSLIGAITSASANKRSQKQLDTLASKQRVPEAVRRIEAILREQAASDMPGMQNQLSDIDTSQAQTISQARDYVSGGGLLGALGKIYTEGNKAKRGVYDANERFKTEAQNRLAAGLGSVVAPAEASLQDDLNSLALAKVGINQAGTQDKLNFMNTGLNAVSNDRGLLAIINSLLGKGKKEITDTSASTGGWLDTMDLGFSSNTTRMGKDGKYWQYSENYE